MAVVGAVPVMDGARRLLPHINVADRTRVAISDWSWRSTRTARDTNSVKVMHEMRHSSHTSSTDDHDKYNRGPEAR